MALSSIAAIETGVAAIFNSLKAFPTKTPNNKAGVESLGEVQAALQAAFKSDITITITDATDADDAALLAASGEVGTALGRSAVPGDIFTVAGSGDTTDNALEVAKGSVVAAGDIFVCPTSATVQYLGNGAPDFTGLTSGDF